jgi:hypothetical protein
MTCLFNSTWRWTHGSSSRCAISHDSECPSTTRWQECSDDDVSSAQFHAARWHASAYGDAPNGNDATDGNANGHDAATYDGTATKAWAATEKLVTSQQRWQQQQWLEPFVTFTLIQAIFFIDITVSITVSCCSG